jgi:uncharacterized protein (DUF58 family)
VISPTPRVAIAAGVLAVAALVVPPAAVLLAGLALATVFLVDPRAARAVPEVERHVPTTIARGVPAPVRVRLLTPGRLRVRQPVPPEVRIDVPEADGDLDATIVAARRGRRALLPPVVRTTGPLGLARRDRTVGEPAQLVVYPDLPAARALAVLVRQGRVGEGRRRGALGLGTDFESVRDHSPDDDVRQVNWRATARVGRPMSNQFRVDQDRDVLCLVDAGRLMAAPLGDRTRLDAALDAVAAVALVADVTGDRCGALAFDREVRRRVPPRRANGRAVVDALFDLEPTGVDSDYDLAFRTLGGKRACVLVFTDLVEPSAATPLLAAIPTLVKRHAVLVASARDTDLVGVVQREPGTALEAYEAAVALDVLDARSAVAGRLRQSGAVVVEADPGGLGAACVVAYLRLKSRALV